MKIFMFYHSLVSDWNHGNAHFLRGIVRELMRAGHCVKVFEPEDGWSRTNLVRDHGAAALEEFERAYPALASEQYVLEALDLDEALDSADLVLVHEWNDPALVQKIGRHRLRNRNYRLLFHDTHHRAVTQPEEMARYDLDGYDGVLAFGEVLRQVYLDNAWTAKAWTWHEAADTAMFRPLLLPLEGELIWIGNWGDEERTAELHDYLMRPVSKLRLRAKVHGVRYPEAGIAALTGAGIHYGGWLPNFRVRDAFARYMMTLHIPRRPYVEQLPGIPTIRVFEALACGIPLISCVWNDCEKLFRPGEDFLVARTPREMREQMDLLRNSADARLRLAENGLQRIHERHTCRHRVRELLKIAQTLGLKTAVEEAA